MNNKKYDYLIVGSGLFGATFAHLAHKQGKKCLVIDKRSHLGGNIYCENIEGINVHKFVNLTYDYFHEMFIRLYPFIKKKEYDEFMHNNKSYISKEFNKLWKCLPFKRRLLLICYNISPKWYSYLLYNLNSATL